MSLLLDTGNFNALWIDGKEVGQLFFNGDKIYDNSSSLWFAAGNAWTGSVSSAWGVRAKNWLLLQTQVSHMAGV